MACGCSQGREREEKENSVENLYVYQCPVFEDFHDPLFVRRELFLRSENRINEWLDAQASEDLAVALPAQAALLAVAREVFRLPPIDRATGHGVPDEQALNVLQHFLRWVEGKAKRG